MNKKLFFGIAVVIVIAAIVGVMVTKDNTAKQSKQDTHNTTEPGNMSTNTPSSPSNTTPAEVAQAATSVTIQNFAFSPANITVKAGTTVTWTNNDSTAHTVTESDGKTGPNSSTLESGKTYSFTYDTAGTYQYHCTIHDNMTGTVTVTE